MRRTPQSLWLLAAAAGLFVAQVVPFTGVFLMMLGAIFWTGLLIDLGFAGIAIEAAIGRVSRWWLLFPAAAFALYAAFVAHDNLAVDRMKAEAARRNATLPRVPFDPIREGMLIASAAPRDRAQDPDVAGKLLGRYRVPNLYARDPYDRPPQIKSYSRADEPVCSEMRKAADAQPKVRVTTIERVHVTRTMVTSAASSACTIATPGTPDEPLVRLAHWSPVYFSRRAAVDRYRVTLPDGRSWQVETGTVRRYRWLPFLFAGCGLDDAASRWRCGASFLTGPSEPLDPVHDDALDLVAGMLGLEPAQHVVR
jgi:hypothetical protein